MGSSTCTDDSRRPSTQARPERFRFRSSLINPEWPSSPCARLQTTFGFLLIIMFEIKSFNSHLKRRLSPFRRLIAADGLRVMVCLYSEAQHWPQGIAVNPLDETWLDWLMILSAFRIACFCCLFVCFVFFSPEGAQESLLCSNYPGAEWSRLHP